MSVVKLQQVRIHARDSSGGMEILAPKLLKIRLDISNSKGSSPLHFLRLRCCWESNAVPIELRVSAAQSALPFVLPRLTMIMPANLPPQEIRILGGLPGLPGASTIMPSVVPCPRTLADRDLGPEPEPEALVVEPGFGPLDGPDEPSSPCESASTFELQDDDSPPGF
jgi:hypothetical protein